MPSVSSSGSSSEPTSCKSWHKVYLRTSPTLHDRVTGLISQTTWKGKRQIRKVAACCFSKESSRLTCLWGVCILVHCGKISSSSMAYHGVSLFWTRLRGCSSTEPQAANSRAVDELTQVLVRVWSASLCRTSWGEW